MNKQDKELLFKDLCARLPYGIIAHYILFNKYSLIGRVYLWTDECFCIKKTDKYSDDWTWNYETATSCAEFDKFKPYLRPMSSMTKKEEKEYSKFAHFGNILGDWTKSIDYLNAHHFDYRGLIEKDLALPATDDMYKTK